MPEHEVSAEEIWLAEHYSGLADFRGSDWRGRWIAIVGQEIVDSDSDSVALATRVADVYGEGTALFASVVTDRLG